MLRELKTTNGERSRETPDLVLNRRKYKADLIPPALLVARYFAEEQSEIERRQAEQDSLSQELEALVEEHGGDDGLLSEATNDKGSLTKGGLKQRLKEIAGDPELAEEQAVLEQCQTLMDAEAAAKKAVKEAQEALDSQVFTCYPKLSEVEIKQLVIGDKWQAALQAAIEAEIERVTQQLANRVQALTERYAEPLPQIVEEVAGLSSKMDIHLQRMGLAW